MRSYSLSFNYAATVSAIVDCHQPSLIEIKSSALGTPLFTLG